MKAVEGWKTEPLGRVARLTMGQSPDSRYYSEEENGLPFLQGCAEFKGRFPKHLLYCSKAKKIAMVGSILFSVRAPVGRINIADRDYIIGRGLAGISGIEVDQAYLEHYLTFVEPNFRNASQGSTFEAINSSELNGWPIEHPVSKTEQTKIAEIISTVDRAIEQTGVLIAKQQRIKTGLMQDLLTHGIDEHGNLRTEQTHQFKDSPLGRIPVEWEVNTIGEIVQEAILGITFRGIRTDNVCPLIKMGNLSWGSLNLDTVEIVDQERDGSDAPQLEYRDFLFNTRNTPELVGKTVVWRSEINRATFDNNLLRLRFHESVASPFLNFYMSFGKGKDEVRALVTGTTSVAAIYWRNFKSYPFPRPPIAEQERTIKVVEDTLRVLDATRAKLHKLRSLKTALMQDLLTGQKRVTGLLRSAI